MDPVAQLHTWPSERVARLLRLRRDLADPPPASLADVTRRAGSSPSLRAAIADLPTASRLVLEALVVLDGPPVDLMVALSEPHPAPEQVERALDDLRDRLLLAPGTTSLALEVAQLVPAPARLGHSLAELLPTLDAGSVQRVALRLGVRPERTKALTIHAVMAAVSSVAGAYDTVSALPAALRERLRALDEEGPVVAVPGLDPSRARYPEGDPALLDLLDSGLIALRGGPYVEVPSEIAIGLRHPCPLRLALPGAEPPGAVPVETAAPAAAGASAAYDVVGKLDAVAQVLDAAPLPLLSTGGVGVRELRRVGEQVGLHAADVAALLELADRLGLVRLMSKDLRLTRTWDTWSRAPEPERWSQLARAWTALSVPPAARSGRGQPALRSYGSFEHAQLRPRLRAVLRAAPQDRRTGPYGSCGSTDQRAA